MCSSAVSVHSHARFAAEYTICCFTQLVAAVQSTGLLGLLVGSWSSQSVLSQLARRFVPPEHCSVHTDEHAISPSRSSQNLDGRARLLLARGAITMVRCARARSPLVIGSADLRTTPTVARAAGATAMAALALTARVRFARGHLRVVRRRHHPRSRGCTRSAPDTQPIPTMLRRMSSLRLPSSIRRATGRP